MQFIIIETLKATLSRDTVRNVIRFLCDLLFCDDLSDRYFHVGSLALVGFIEQFNENSKSAKLKQSCNLLIRY